MITRQETTLFGLSTDTKPDGTENNGTCFIEMDTGSIYFYDAENETWQEWNGA